MQTTRPHATPKAASARSLQVVVHQFEGAEDLRAMPLAAGLLVATAERALGAHISTRIVRARRPVHEVVEDHRVAPDVLAFSCYTWNERYTIEVARAASLRWPEALIVLGGPSVPRDAARLGVWLTSWPFLDALVLGEGELSFVELLRAAREGHPLTDVAGLALRAPDGAVVMTAERPRMRALTESTSPYLAGTFADLDARGVNAAVVETNRGCPFSCTFCDWGQATGSRVVELPLERVKAELDWVGERQIPFLYIIDANFGIRRRDESIIAHLVEVKARTGFPTFCYFHLTKNANVRNLRTVERLQAAGIGCRMALSMQDFDPVVLTAIARSNIKLEHSLHLRELCHDKGIPTFNELLLGLPGQTLSGFCASVVKAITPFEADTFSLYLTRLLENAAMASEEHRTRFGLKTSWVLAVSPNPDYVAYVDELEEVVVATDAMPSEDWAQAYRFGYLLSVCYNQGLAREALTTLRFSAAGVEDDGVDAVVSGIGALLDAMVSSTEGSWLSQVDHVFERYLRSIRAGGPMLLPMAGLGDRRWTIEEALTMTLQPQGEALARWTREHWPA